MKRLLTILFTLLIAVSLLTACGDNSEERVMCTIFNGLGQVKYYSGRVIMILLWVLVQAVTKKDTSLLLLWETLTEAIKSSAVVVKNMWTKLLQKTIRLAKPEHGVRNVGKVIMG